MMKLIIISLLVIQSSASFFEAFAPVENSFSKLVTDVVSDIAETIDCTILAVEQVFSLDGLFGSPSNYDERCRGVRAQQPAETVTDSESSYTMDKYVEATTPSAPIKKYISQEVNASLSNVSHQIKEIIKQSNADEKIENVKKSLKSEAERLSQISEVLKRELDKVPKNIMHKFDFTPTDHPTVESLFDQIKTLYRIEQKDKSSAESNKVRHSFDEILNILHLNDLTGTLSDEDEVKVIINNLGKMSNDSFVDVEKQVEQWTEEQNKQLKSIKDVVISTTNGTKVIAKSINDVNGTNTEEIIHDKLDKIEKEQEKMIDFSNSLKVMAKDMLDKVSVTNSPLFQITTVQVPILVPNLESDDHTEMTTTSIEQTHVSGNSGTDDPLIPIKSPFASSTEEKMSTITKLSDTTQSPVSVPPKQPDAQSQQLEPTSEDKFASATPQSSRITSQMPTNIPKTFKEVAKQITQRTTMSTETDDDIDYEGFDYDSDEDTSKSLIDKLFGPKDKKAQKAAEEETKNLIERSQLSNKIMNDFFQNSESEDTTGVFDDPELSFFA